MSPDVVVVGGGLAWLLLGPGAKKGVLVPDPGALVATAVPLPTPLPEPTAAPTAVPPTPAPTVATTGTAVLSSNVYAQVSVDGAPHGGVFKPTRVTVPPGKHVAAFQIADFGPIRVPFEVRAGESVEVRGEFPPLGQLSISVNPDAFGAEVLVDGVVVGHAGASPLRKTVAAGSHRVEARLAGFGSEEKTVEVYEQDKADVLLTLRRR